MCLIYGRRPEADPGPRPVGASLGLTLIPSCRYTPAPGWEIGRASKLQTVGVVPTGRALPQRARVVDRRRDEAPRRELQRSDPAPGGRRDVVLRLAGIPTRAARSGDEEARARPPGLRPIRAVAPGGGPR